MPEQRILDSIRRIVRALRVSSRVTQSDFGLSGAQLFVLQKLRNEPSLSMNELALRTHTHQSSVSVVVARLVERGLVSRKASREDSRRADISLTSKGLRLIESAPDPAQERLLSALERLPKRERTELAVLLEQVVREAGFAGEMPELFFEEEK